MSDLYHTDVRRYVIKYNGMDLYTGTLSALHMHSIVRVFLKHIRQSVDVKRIDKWTWEAYIVGKPADKYIMCVNSNEVVRKQHVLSGYIVATCEKCGELFTTRKDKPLSCCKDCGRKTPRNHTAINNIIRRDILGMRRCHDCGMATINYRCNKCWEKLRKKGNYSIYSNEGDYDNDY